MTAGYERKKIEFDGLLVDKECDVFHVLFWNEGATKAINTRVETLISVVNERENKTLFRQSNSEEFGILAPFDKDDKSTIVECGITLCPGLGQKILEAIEDETASIHFSGSIIYQDILSPPSMFRFTKFSYKWESFYEDVPFSAEDGEEFIHSALVHQDWVKEPKEANCQH